MVAPATIFLYLPTSGIEESHFPQKLSLPSLLQKWEGAFIISKRQLTPIRDKELLFLP